MLHNLEKARLEKEITKAELGDLLKVKYQTITSKIEGKTSFTFDEALLIQKEYFPEYELTYLFGKEKQKSQKG